MTLYILESAEDYPPGMPHLAEWEEHGRFSNQEAAIRALSNYNRLKQFDTRWLRLRKVEEEQKVNG
jgi:hypothetical protein